MPESMVRCPACDRDSAGVNFCTGCGLDLRARADPPAQPPRRAQPRLVACPFCGATNAATRRHCGRCGRAEGDEADEVHDEAPVTELPDVVGDVERPVSATFVAVAVVAAIAMLAVALTVLGGQGIGPLAAQPEPTPTDVVAVPIASARASSSLPPSGDVGYEPANVLDGDLETAWQDAASGEGVGEWLELRLAGPALVSRVMVANGYQKPGQFEQNARVAKMRIVTDERAFTADLLDVRGMQAVDLPEPVRTRRVRLEILELHPGTRYSDAGFSSVRLYGPAE
jgi:hypothetical protein